MDFFSQVVKGFNHGELQILNVLYESEALNTYTSIPKHVIEEETQLSIADSRKHLTCLERLMFVSRVTGSKMHSYYITQYGLAAIEKITSENVGDQ